jgi:catechol 2,3-dioxygenase-like lactoylglutathione lyase family enzyme
MLQDARIVAVIPVKDFARARSFYENVLGLLPERAMEDADQVVYSLNGTRLMVYRTGVELGEATKVGFLVSDLDREMQDLRAHGVKFEDFDLPGFKSVDGVMERPGGRAAWFRDPDGNYLVLREMS